VAPTNGWRSGRDPVQRWLRVVTTIVVLGVFVYLSITLPSTPIQTHAAEIVVVIALALGATLVLLGYEGLVKLPIIGRKESGDNE
jgi:hypothetical protein